MMDILAAMHDTLIRQSRNVSLICQCPPIRTITVSLTDDMDMSIMRADYPTHFFLYYLDQ